VRAKLVLAAIGVALAIVGVWVISMPIQVNLGNQCGEFGCNNVSGAVPSAVPGVILIVGGLAVVAYGLGREEGDQG